jgi:hypothetical protein
VAWQLAIGGTPAATWLFPPCLTLLHNPDGVVTASFLERVLAKMSAPRAMQLVEIDLSSNGIGEDRKVAWVDRSEIGIPRTDPNLRGKATFITVIFEHAQ